MPISNQQISEAFSNGNFEFTFPFLADDIEWNIVGERILTGKEKVINFCNETAAYFASVTTVFITENVIIGNDVIAINGKGTFTTKEAKITNVSSCDVYDFKEGELKKITSYCITNHKKQS